MDSTCLLRLIPLDRLRLCWDHFARFQHTWCTERRRGPRSIRRFAYLRRPRECLWAVNPEEVFRKGVQPVPFSLSLLVFLSGPNIEYVLRDRKGKHLSHKARKHIETYVGRGPCGNLIKKCWPSDQNSGESRIRLCQLWLLCEFHNSPLFIGHNDAALSRVGHTIGSHRHGRKTLPMELQDLIEPAIR